MSYAARLVFVARTAVEDIALKFASATSAACLLAFCTLSNVLFAAATADLTSATALSLPAGAFLTAVSTIAINLACASALVA